MRLAAGGTDCEKSKKEMQEYVSTLNWWHYVLTNNYLEKPEISLLDLVTTFGMCILSATPNRKADANRNLATLGDTIHSLSQAQHRNADSVQGDTNPRQKWQCLRSHCIYHTRQKWQCLRSHCIYYTRQKWHCLRFHCIYLNKYHLLVLSLFLSDELFGKIT